MIYHSSNLIPEAALTVYYTLLIIALIPILIFRTVISLKAGRTLDKNMNIRGLLRALFSTRLMLIIFPIITMFAILPFKVMGHWGLTDVLPYIAIVLGLTLNILGVIIREIEYTIAGYWLITAGIIGLFLIVLPVHISPGAIFGSGCLVFAATAYFNEKKRLP